MELHSLRAEQREGQISDFGVCFALLSHDVERVAVWLNNPCVKDKIKRLCSVVSVRPQAFPMLV